MAKTCRVGGVSESDTSTLFERLSAGDRAAFDTLVRRFWEPVMRFCWKRTSAAEAEDLAQEVFTAVYRGVRHGRTPRISDADGWRRYIWSCARNRVIDYWRRTRTRPPAQALTDLVGDECGGGVGSDHSSAGTDAAKAPISREQSDAIRDCMNRLDVQSRAACWLLFVERRSKREIARMLDKPESSLRSGLVEAIRVLRQCLVDKGMAPEV